MQRNYLHFKWHQTNTFDDDPNEVKTGREAGSPLHQGTAGHEARALTARAGHP